MPAGCLPLLLQFLLSLSDASSSTWQQKAQKKNGMKRHCKTFLKKQKGPICPIVHVKRQLNLSFQTWQGVPDFPERRRKGVVLYLLPPLQLTKDALKALVHVVELGGEANGIVVSACNLSHFSSCSLWRPLLSHEPTIKIKFKNRSQGIKGYF